MEESGNMDEPIKKKRGNPNFGKGKQNTYFDKDKMAETVEEIKEPVKPETPSSEPTPAQEPVNNAPKVEFNMDIFSDVMPDDILPLDDEVKTKDYAKLNEGLGNGASPSGPGAPSTNGSGGGGSVASGTGLSTEGKSLEEMRSEAEQFVDFTLRAYDKAHDLSRGLVKINQEKLAIEHEEGKINLNHTFPLKGNPSIGQLVSNFNESIDETIVVDDKFKTDISPPMVRIAMKHKLGMSDEFRVISLIAEDAITKVSILIGLKSAMSDILNMSREQLKVAKQSQQKQQAPPKDPSYTEFVEEPTNDWRDAPSN